MVICDANLRVLFEDAKFPESVHDAAVGQVSDMKAAIRRQDAGSWLLVVKKFTTKNTPAVEMLWNGVLKNRNRYMHWYRTLHYSPLKACQIIYAVLTLHCWRGYS